MKTGSMILACFLLIGCVTAEPERAAKPPYNSANLQRAASACHAQVVASDSSSITLNGFYPSADINKWAACLRSKLELPRDRLFAIDSV